MVRKNQQNLISRRNFVDIDEDVLVGGEYQDLESGGEIKNMALVADSDSDLSDTLQPAAT